jgi:dTDP-4-dehydrorhamnose reductase
VERSGARDPWPLGGEPILAEKDRRGVPLSSRRAVCVRILLTGRNGQVGWELERMLAPVGEVIALDRAQLDLCDETSIRRAARASAPNVIVNAAAYTAVDRAESEPVLASAVNGIAAAILAEEARRCDALLVHYSTDYVFDGEKGVPVPGGRSDQPGQRLWPQQARGRAGDPGLGMPAPDSCARLGLCRARATISCARCSNSLASAAS